MRDLEHRAAEAQRLLGEPLLQEAIEKIERDAFEAMLSAKTDQERFELTLRVNALRDIRSHIERVVMDGASAARPRGGVA